MLIGHFAMRASDMGLHSVSMDGSELLVEAHVPKLGIEKAQSNGKFRVEVLQLGELPPQRGVSIPISAVKRVLHAMANAGNPTRG
jgi:hypothetical protein